MGPPFFTRSLEEQVKGGAAAPPSSDLDGNRSDDVREDGLDGSARRADRTGRNDRDERHEERVLEQVLPAVLFDERTQMSDEIHDVFSCASAVGMRAAGDKYGHASARPRGRTQKGQRA